MATENATDTTWWALVSAFGGAVVGGLISYLLQRQSLAAASALHDADRKQHAADRKEVRKAIGYGLLFKMIRLCSDLSQMGMPVSALTVRLE